MLETILRRTALTCAVLMLVGALIDVATWALLIGGGMVLTDGAISSLSGLFSGIVAVIALVVAVRARPGIAIPLRSLLVTMAAFGQSLFASMSGPWIRLQGKIWISSSNAFPGDLARQSVFYPMARPYVFTFVTVLGGLATIGIDVIWLRGAQGSRGSRTEPVPHVPESSDA